MLRAHLDQFPSERKLCLVDPQRLGQRGADLQAALVDIRLPPLQVAQVAADPVGLLGGGATLDGEFDAAVDDLLQTGADLALELMHALPRSREGCRVGDLGQSHFGEQFCMPSRPASAILAPLGLLRHQPIELREPGPACAVALAQQPKPGPIQRVDGGLGAGEIGLQVVYLARDRRQPGGEQGQFLFCGPDRQSLLVEAVCGHGLAEFFVLATLGKDGIELSELVARSTDCLVGSSEVVEVAHERRDARGGVVAFEHVTTDEVGEVADRLHRNRLVQQFEGLHGLDA